MCGIIAYKGKKTAFPLIINGLKDLEYRGYDSWGIACASEKQMKIVKKVGKVSNAKTTKSTATTAIGHTRWATHGKVNKTNTHPHTDCENKIAIVHNGIVENYLELKKNLKNHRFRSETDTEAIAHIIEQKMNEGLSFEEATRQTVKKIKGRSAVVAMHKDTEKIVAARKGTPLIAGIDDNGYFLGSDINAFLKHTQKVSYLDEEEMVEIGSKLTFKKIENGEKIKKKLIQINWTLENSEKKGYKHFLLKEIMEQKKTIWQAINQKDAKILSIAKEIKKAKGTFLIGSGTAGKVCMTGEYLFSKIAKKHVNFCIASEFSNYKYYLTPQSLIIAVSQSGETADVLQAIEFAKEKKSKTLSLLNVFGSSMMRESDHYFMVNAGTEKAVVSTKATTAQIAVMMLLAYAVSGRLEQGKTVLMDAARQVNDMLNPGYQKRIQRLALELHKKKDIYIIGRSLNYPIALESAIKLQETAYINAQGFAGGELKHGPLALIGKNTPCITLVAEDESKHETLSNAMEVKSRGGTIIGIAPKNSEVFDRWIKVPDVGNASPIVNIIPIQMLAYYIAKKKGNDPDRPKNLAKSLTVK